jgi:hypothetical protein
MIKRRELRSRSSGETEEGARECTHEGYVEIGDTELVSTGESTICASVELLLVEQCGRTVGREEGEMEKLYIGALRVGRANVFCSLTLAEAASQAKLPPTQSKAYAQGQTKVRTPRYRVGQSSSQHSV